MKRRRGEPPWDNFTVSSGLTHAEIRRGVNQLVERARKMEGPSEPRKHHVVPASFLERWAVDGRLRATDLANGKSFPVSPHKAARDTDFYRVESDDLDREFVPPLLFEAMLGDIEGSAVTAIDAVIAGGPNHLNRDVVVALASFVAFQFGRGHRSRTRSQSMVNSGFVEMYRHVTEDGMRDYLGGAPDSIELASAMEFVDGLRSGEIVVEQRQAAAVWQIGTTAEKCLPYLLSRRWHVVSTETELVLTDEPVLLLGGPGWPRGQLAGVGSARIVAMPLSPRHLLVLTSTDVLDDGRYDEQLTVDETEEINLELLVNAHRWLFSTLKRTARLPVIPPPTPPWILERGISIAGQPASELLHGFSPNRWLYADRTPWPVERWWDGQARTRSTGPTPFLRGQTVAITPEATEG